MLNSDRFERQFPLPRAQSLAHGKTEREFH